MMKIKLMSILLCFAATSVFAQVDRSTMPEPGPAPKINIGEPKTFKFNNGLRVLVVENDKLPRVTARLIIDNKPFTEENPGTSSLLSAMLGTGTENISKDDFNEEIDFLGARVGYGSSSASASSLSKYFPRIMELMADGALNPVFSEEEFESEKRKLIEGIKSDRKNTSAVTSRVSSALTYGKDHPYGEFATEESIENITLDDVKKMYEDYFVPENAYMVIVGDINKRKAKRLVRKNFKKWDKGTPPESDFEDPTDVDQTQINFVDMPNAVQSEVTVQNLVDLKMSDDDYFAVLLMNDILGGSFGSYLNMNLREDKGWTYGARSSVGASRYASRFRASAQVRNAVTDSTVVEMLKEIDRIRNEKVDATKLQEAKQKFAGNFTLQLESPSTIARFALNIETNDLPEDFYETYLERMDEVTVEDVNRVAKKYLKPNQLRFVIGGKGSDVANGLENVSYNGKTLAVKYFDRKANEVERPVFSKPIPEGVNIETVYNNFIEALGGEDKLKAVKSVSKKGSALTNGMKLNITEIKTSKGQSLTEISMQGNVVQKMVFDGEKGYMEAQGQKMEYEDEQNKAMKETAGLFPELEMPESAELKNIQSVEGEDAYVVIIDENVKEFYSVESGLKLQTEETQENQGQTSTTTTTYSDYKEVDGIKFAHKLNQDFGQQALDIEYTEIKLDEKISNKKFQ
ncbi:MAG: M16 family metallopeptidase [Bacteroidota bacterium]